MTLRDDHLHVQSLRNLSSSSKSGWLIARQIDVSVKTVLRRRKEAGLKEKHPAPVSRLLPRHYKTARLLFTTHAYWIEQE